MQKDGQKLFIIEKKIRGERFHVSTRCHDWDAAMVQYAKFQASPGAYNPAVELLASLPVFLTTDSIIEYFKHCVLPKAKGGRANSFHHAREKANRLADWQEDLEGKDLRKLDLIRDLKAALDRRVTCRSHRIIAIKNYFAWLRTEKGTVRHAEDRTLDLLVPQAVPENRKRQKVVPWEHVQLVSGELEQRWLDVMMLKVATGMHLTELERFVRDPKAELVPAPPGADHLAALKFLHKNQGWEIVPLIHPEQVAAAARLKEEGTFPGHLNDRLKAACEVVNRKRTAAGEKPIPRFTHGLMRHSVATWAIAAGASAAAVAVFLGHKDPKTTKRFYIDHNVAVPAIPTRRLLKLVSG